MPIDYRRARQDGAYLFIDDFNDRVLLLGADYDGDPSTAEEGDEGVIEVYHLEPNALLTGILDALADAGVNVDWLLNRANSDDPYQLPKLRIAKEDSDWILR